MTNEIYDYLIFKLDDEFESYELKVIPIPPYKSTENNFELKIYEYFGEINEVLGLRLKQIFLFFNSEKLLKVELIFEGNKINYLKYKLESLSIQKPSVMFLKMYHKEGLTHLTYYNKILKS